MISTSEAFQELMKSNVRPKCEPVITISGIDNNGNETTLTWQAKDIKTLTYKRGIDPVGRELPYMELSWTEIYKGKLNAQNYPEKYNNIVKYMAVELSFVQSLGFYNSWKTIFNGNISWKTLFENNVTWKKLKNGVSTETIKLPKMFLEAKPSIDGQTITWSAKDFLFFLDEKIIEEYGDEYYSVPFTSPLILALSSIFKFYEKSPSILAAIDKTTENLSEQMFDNFKSPDDDIDKKIIVNSSIKNFCLNYANLRNRYYSFKSDGSFFLQNIEFALDTAYLFSKKVMYTKPKITNCANISAYNFKHYVKEQDETSNYAKNYTDTFHTIQRPEDEFYNFYFNEYGICLEKYNPNRYIDYTLTSAVTNDSSPIVVTPIYWNGYDNTLSTNLTGENYNEDNPINPYNANSSKAIERLEFLKKYFNSNATSIEFEALPNLSIEPGDGVFIESNLYDGEIELIKKAVIVQIEISYNGSIKEKVIAHEYDVGLG